MLVQEVEKPTRWRVVETKDVCAQALNQIQVPLNLFMLREHFASAIRRERSISNSFKGEFPVAESERLSVHLHPFQWLRRAGHRKGKLRCGCFRLSLGRFVEDCFDSLFRSAFQFVVHAYVIFPHQIFDLWRFGINDHGGALKILHEFAISDVRKPLNEHLVKMFRGFGFVALVKQQKILHLPGVNGAVHPILPRDKDAGESEDRYGMNCEAIPAKELHGDF